MHTELAETVSDVPFPEWFGKPAHDPSRGRGTTEGGGTAPVRSRPLSSSGPSRSVYRKPATVDAVLFSTRALSSYVVVPIATPP